MCLCVRYVGLYLWLSISITIHHATTYILYIHTLTMMSCFKHVLYLTFILNLIMIFIPGGHPPWPADHDGGHNCGLHPCQHPPHTRLQRPEVAQSAGELPLELETKVIQRFPKISQSRRRPLQGPSSG